MIMAAAFATPKINTVANCWTIEDIWLAETASAPRRPRIIDWIDTPIDQKTSLNATGSPFFK